MFAQAQAAVESGGLPDWVKAIFVSLGTVIIGGVAATISYLYNRRHEHEKWMRDKAFESYIEYHAACEQVMEMARQLPAQLAEAQFRDAHSNLGNAIDRFAMAEAAVMFHGSDDVMLSVFDLHAAVTSTVRESTKLMKATLLEFLQIETHDDPVGIEHDPYTEAVSAFTNVVRAEARRNRKQARRFRRANAGKMRDFFG